MLLTFHSVSRFSQSLTTVLVSRLVLNLRKQRLHSVDGIHIPSQVEQSGATRSRLANLTSLASIRDFFDVGHDLCDHEMSQFESTIPPPDNTESSLDGRSTLERISDLGQISSLGQESIINAVEDPCEDSTVEDAC